MGAHPFHRRSIKICSKMHNRKGAASDGNPKTKSFLKISLLFLLFAALVAVVYSGILPLSAQGVYPMKEAALVERYADENGLDEALVYAVMKTESDFDAEAVSAAKAKGLMQLTLPTFQWLQSKTGETLEGDALFDKEVNVRYGTLFLRLLKEEFGTTQEILAAYHAGRGQVNRWLKDPGVSQDGKTTRQHPYPRNRPLCQKGKRTPCTATRIFII